MLSINKRNLIILSILVIAILFLYYWDVSKLPEYFREWQVFQRGEKGLEELSQQEFQLTREYVMDYISNHIFELSPVPSVLGGKWQVNRFWFATDRDVYVEYEDGHILRQILISIEGENQPFDWKITAYFEPGENGWIVKVGEDTMFGRPLELYEWNESREQWVKKN